MTHPSRLTSPQAHALPSRTRRAQAGRSREKTEYLRKEGSSGVVRMTRRAHAQLASAPACACATTLSRPLQDLRVPGGRHGGRQEWACWKDSSHTVHSTSAISPEFMLCGPCLVLSCLALTQGVGTVGRRSGLARPGRCVREARTNTEPRAREGGWPEPKAATRHRPTKDGEAKSTPNSSRK